VNLHLQIDLEYEALLALRHDLLQLCVQVMRFGDRIRPVQVQNRSRHDLRLITPWIQRIFAGA
jgi:hypothetical protein